ncbi:MAG: type III pantothenate kinase [Burkholderiales bacterium]|nr:type III pantothenate kinase [Burkholderiales bacterium]
MTATPKTLLLDAGNSRLKWACAAVGQPGTVATGVCGYDVLDSLPAALPTGVVKALGCNVAGEDVASRLVATLAPIAIDWLRPTAEMAGVRNGYRNPGQLGADRWAALIGARARSAEATIVVMAGTAMTVDALTAQGDFLGGLIVPGYRLMRESLSRGTADLGLPEGDVNPFPQSTGEAIVNGALLALAGAIREMSDRLAALSGKLPTILLSGGDATRLTPLLASALAGKVIHVDNLVLEGLACISSLPGLHPTTGRNSSP